MGDRAFHAASRFAEQPVELDQSLHASLANSSHPRFARDLAHRPFRHLVRFPRFEHLPAPGRHFGKLWIVGGFGKRKQEREAPRWRRSPPRVLRPFRAALQLPGSVHEQSNRIGIRSAPWRRFPRSIPRTSRSAAPLPCPGAGADGSQVAREPVPSWSLRADRDATRSHGCARILRPARSSAGESLATSASVGESGRNPPAPSSKPNPSWYRSCGATTASSASIELTGIRCASRRIGSRLEE